MSWKAKLLSGLLGVLFLLSPLWPLGLLCFLYILLPRRSRGSKKSEGGQEGGRPLPWRRLAGLFLLLLSAVALASGGTLSVAVFISSGTIILEWPAVARRLSLSQVVPVGNSILLRSKYLPYRWCALAEVKRGQDEFPRAASSFEGTLLVFTDSGKAYSLFACNALTAGDAESKLLGALRSASSMGRGGAFLLPLDSTDAADVLRIRTSPARLQSKDLADSASRLSGLLLLECRRGFAAGASAFELGAPGAPSLPGMAKELRSAPLLWEVLDAVGRRTRWPDPDQYSNLLYTLAATRGVPLGDRVKELQEEEGKLRVQALSGEEVQSSRPQFRALVSMYS